MSENIQGPPPVPNNKQKGTTNESKIPPSLPKAKIIAVTSPQDETSTAKNDVSAGKKLPTKLPGKESQTPPPLAPSMRQNARQTKFSTNSQTSNTATTQAGNKGKLFLFVIGVAAALIVIISISNGSGNDVPLDRGHTFDYSDDEEYDSEDSDVGYSEPEVQSTPEPEPYVYDGSSNYQQGNNSEENVDQISNDVIEAIIVTPKETKKCSFCPKTFRVGQGFAHLRPDYCSNQNFGEYCSVDCCDAAN